MMLGRLDTRDTWRPGLAIRAVKGLGGSRV